MKLEQLEIRGFGRLRDAEFSFHPRLTIIVGDNESGKSTLMRALRAALFGIDSGGQGRAAERSPWARFTPWSNGEYGIALTYKLDDERRFRVARNLEQREERVQVMELGGKEQTDEMRFGRHVNPGLFHLGIEEQVCTATCWLSEEGLRQNAAESPWQRASVIHEALQQIVDSRGHSTSAQAQQLLRTALERIGTEKRSASQLGQLSHEIRRLDAELDRARQRLAALAASEEQLRNLQRDARAADDRRLDVEKQWLLGSLASITEQQQILEDSHRQMTELEVIITDTSAFADFATQQREAIRKRAGDWQELERLFREAEARAQGARESLQRVMNRRAEIAGGITAMGMAADLPPDLGETIARLKPELAAAKGTLARDFESEATDSRLQALQQELAATGFASIPAHAVEIIQEPLQILLNAKPQPWMRIPRWLFPIAAFSAAIAAAMHQGLIAAGILVACSAVALALVFAAHLRTGDVASARRQLARLCPEISCDRATLERLEERLPALCGLHEDIRRQQLIHEHYREEQLAAINLARDLAERLERILSSNGLSVTNQNEITGDWIAIAEGHLDTLEVAIANEVRRADLALEDQKLAEDEISLRRFFDDEEQRRHQRAAVEHELRDLLRRGGIPDGTAMDDAIAQYEYGCEQRRRYEEARLTLEQLKRRIAPLGDQTLMRRRQHEYELRLLERGGNPAASQNTAPLLPAALHELELQQERASREAQIANQRASELSARLQGARDGIPSIPELEDQRALLVMERDQALAQVNALRLAMEKLDLVTQVLHQELAPRLSEAIGARLGEITTGRYSKINLDRDNFAVSVYSRERSELVPLDLLSHGTRDQISLLLRLALAEILSNTKEQLPLMLDEPLLSADPQRRHAINQCLAQISRTNQVILATADNLMAEQLSQVADGDCEILALPGLQAASAQTKPLLQRVK